MFWQKHTDNFIDKIFLGFIPRNITPNQVTMVRIFSLPVIFYLLWSESYVWGVFIFSIVALTDALDGAMARKRNQETELGKVLDAVADRGLILLVAIILIPKYFSYSLLFSMLTLEMVNAFMAYRSKRRLGQNPGANWAGKIKMIVQCLAFIFLFIGVATNGNAWLNTSETALYISLALTILQSFLYP